MADYYAEEDDYGEQGEQEYAEYAKPKLSNSLPVWGNQRTMNINNLVLTNIQASPYFKVKLYGLKTYHEVIDEIYYKVRLVFFLYYCFVVLLCHFCGIIFSCSYFEKSGRILFHIIHRFGAVINNVT